MAFDALTWSSTCNSASIMLASWMPTAHFPLTAKASIGKTQLLSVRVSSHTVSGKTTLQSLVEDKNKRSRLKRVDQTAIVDVNWLRSTCRPKIAPVINKLLLGSKVMLLDGANICTAEPLNFAFSGSTKTVEGFLSLPQGHEPVEFNIEQPTAPDPKKLDKKEIWYDLQCNVTKRMCKIQKDLHASFNLPYAPPPPKNTTQIVKLKWLPSKQSKRRAGDGIWHGLYVVNMGASTTLQECSLTEDWVEAAFSVAFRKECKDIAAGDSMRNKNEFLHIPAGDARPDDGGALVQQLDFCFTQQRLAMFAVN
jgi:hypothetical protein